MKHIITYIPLDDVNKCSIHKIFELTKFGKFQRLFKSGKQLVVKGKNPELKGILKNSTVDKVICFAHKHDTYPILLTAKNEFISADWFGEQFNTGIFFVTDSASLFENSNHKIWVEKFNHWVAFSETFQPFAYYKDCLDLQQQMYKEFLKVSATKRNGLEISNALKEIYDKYIDEFSVLCHDEKSDSNQISMTVAMLQLNRESIVYGN